MNIVARIMQHKRMMAFLEKYREGYGEEYFDILKTDYRFFLQNLQLASVHYYQIFSYLDFFKDDRDVYRVLLNRLQEFFSLEQDILEVGCGNFPAFARLIDEEQQRLGNGSIAAYDDALVTENLGRIDLHKKLLTNEDVGDFDLLVSTYSCSATDKVLELAREYKLPYFLHMCSCNHGFSSKEVWYNFVYHQAKSELDSGAILDIDYVNLAGKNFDYPILIKSYRGR